MDTKLKKLKTQANKILWISLAILFTVLLFFGAVQGFGAVLFIAGMCISLTYFIVREYLNTGIQDYEKIFVIIEKLAEGNFEEIPSDNLGVFEPMKEALRELKNGFQNAVEKKVHSERMKTELITNVSHDLKTPLTAITTYVELLKKEDITEKERNSYIEILEKKSARMKILIEDLFDLSKASSNDLALDITNVDIVNLMRQIAVEHQEKYEELGLQLIWNVPEEKIEVQLDNQKTYRIFENLFLNIEKYAMANSRVYIDVCIKKDVEITV